MSLNATMLGQMITFAIFVFITLKWIWPLFNTILQQRAKKIADGLAAADKGHRDLELAEHKIRELMHDAKQEVASLLEKANERAHLIVEESKQQARKEGKKMIEHAQIDIDKQVNAAKNDLRKQVASLAIASAEKILQQSIDKQAANQVLDKFIAEI